MNNPTSCDASVLINFLRINRIDLLGKCSHSFFITDHVQEEISVCFPAQRACLQLGLYRNNLKNRFMPRRRPDFRSGTAGAEAAKLKKFSDAGGLKSGGCPTPAETGSSGCFGIHQKILQKTNVESPEEFELFVNLNQSHQLGAGECAAIAVASHRGFYLAIDDNQAIRKTAGLLASSRILRTQDLILTNLSNGFIRKEIQCFSGNIFVFGAEGKGGPPPLAEVKKQKYPGKH